MQLLETHLSAQNGFHTYCRSAGWQPITDEALRDRVVHLDCHRSRANSRPLRRWDSFDFCIWLVHVVPARYATFLAGVTTALTMVCPHISDRLAMPTEVLTGCGNSTAHKFTLAVRVLELMSVLPVVRAILFRCQMRFGLNFGGCKPPFCFRPITASS